MTMQKANAIEALVAAAQGRPGLVVMLDNDNWYATDLDVEDDEDLGLPRSRTTDCRMPHDLLVAALAALGIKAESV